MEYEERFELIDVLNGIKKEIHGNGLELDHLYDRLDDIATCLRVIAFYCALHTGGDRESVNNFMTLKGW